MDARLSDAIRVTRQLSVDLSPPILHGEDLVEAVIWLASQMGEQYGLKVDIQSNGTPAELDEKVRVLVFYALRDMNDWRKRPTSSFFSRKTVRGLPGLG